MTALSFDMFTPGQSLVEVKSEVFDVGPHWNRNIVHSHLWTYSTSSGECNAYQESGTQRSEEGGVIVSRNDVTRGTIDGRYRQGLWADVKLDSCNLNSSDW
jgi:hypothetical protein